MKARMLILAAGLGSRLMPLTQMVPKCMVKYKGRAIIDYILDSTKACQIDEIGVVGGYRADVLRKYLCNKITHFYENINFSSTNMVETLFCGREFLKESFDKKQDVIISYADIIYKPFILSKLLSCRDEISVVVDKDWQELWSKRFDDPLSDAESLKIQDGRIIEIGKKPSGYEDIQAQYMGLFKISYLFLPKILELYDHLDTTKLYDSKDFKNMYMTSFITQIIEHFNNVRALEIRSGWLEIDQIKDLEIEF